MLHGSFLLMQHRSAVMRWLLYYSQRQVMSDRILWAIWSYPYDSLTATWSSLYWTVNMCIVGNFHASSAVRKYTIRNRSFLKYWLPYSVIHALVWCVASVLADAQHTSHLAIQFTGLPSKKDWRIEWCGWVMIVGQWSTYNLIGPYSRRLCEWFHPCTHSVALRRRPANCLKTMGALNLSSKRASARQVLVVVFRTGSTSPLDWHINLGLEDNVMRSTKLIIQ